MIAFSLTLIGIDLATARIPVGIPDPLVIERCSVKDNEAEFGAIGRNVIGQGRMQNLIEEQKFWKH